MSFRIATLIVTFISVVATAVGHNPGTEAQQLFDRGRELDKAYKYDSALILYEKARSLFPKGSEGEGLACRFIGDIYKYVLYDFDKAELNYERSLEIQMQLDPSHVRNRTRLYYNLATTNRSQHDYETAITWCLKAIEGSLELKDNAYLERSYSILGNIYRDMHKFDSAFVYYERGVGVNKEINKGKPNETLAGIYSAWGSANFEEGNLDEASEKLSDAIGIYQQVEVKDKLLYLHTARQLAEVEINRDNPDKAYSYLEMVDKMRRELKLEKGGPASSVYKTFGDYFLKKGVNEAATDYYTRALVAATDQESEELIDFGKIKLKPFAYEALIARGNMHLTKYEGDKLSNAFIPAFAEYVKAEKLLVASRNDLDTEDAKWQFVDANYRLYEKIFYTLYKMRGAEDGLVLLHFMERSKSKSLADALQEVELKKSLGRNDTLLSSLKNLKQQSLSLQHQINQKNDATARDQQLRISQKISALEASINSRYPSYLKTKFESASVDLTALKSKLKSLDAAFVEYFWGDENIYALVVSGDSTEFYQVKNSNEVEAGISKYTGLFKAKGNSYSKEDVAGFLNISNGLYSKLLKPFEQHLFGHKRLIIVPDGLLIQLPFETLVTNNTGESYRELPYLLNTHYVSYVFSASHLLATRPAVKSNPSMLALGFTGGTNERSVEQAAIEIAGSETELVALSGKFPRGTYLYGAGVTEKSFKEQAANFDLLHIAVHGKGDTGEDYSATLYFRDEEGPEDGRLYWYELYNMNLKASLAVLSSCESGIGKTYRGEGMLSMANAFTFAGCGNIVMGLWKVDDQVSVKLMDTFYSELLNGMAIDEALALAKRTYLATADQVSANPKLWGSLVAYGESPILKADEIPTWWVVLALTALVAAIAVLVIKTRKK